MLFNSFGYLFFLPISQILFQINPELKRDIAFGLFHVKYYYDGYIYLSMAIVLFTMFHSWILKMDDPKNISFIKAIGFFLLFFLIFYIGLRPVTGRYFTDMRTYANTFDFYKSGGDLRTDKDLVFQLYMKFCATFLSIHVFFLLCAFLYIFPMYRISKAFFKEYWYYSFLFFIVSFSFWGYGTNGIRNGIATSLFLWGLSYQKEKTKMIVLCVLAALFHESLLLPVFAFVTTFFYKKPKFYLMCWLAAIILSLAFGSFWTTFFTSLGFGDDRLTGYLTSEADAQAFSHVGFRWDFLFYSAFGVFAGWYFIFKKQFEDKLYLRLISTYLIANGFWILVIGASFSNRFAYLSWFMMPIIIIYPLLKQKFYNNQNLMIGKMLLAYFSFTFFMYTIYYADKH